MAAGRIRRVVTTAALTAVPVLLAAAPAAAQSGAGGTLHQYQSGATSVTDTAVYDARF